MTSQHTYLPEETVIQRAIEALMQSLGPVETARFLQLIRSQTFDYRTWRRQWQESLDKDDFLDEVFGNDESED